MTDWSKLSEASGSAEGVPVLLDRFEADPPGVWQELLDRLCPRPRVSFSAGSAALPRLAEIAASREPGERYRVLFAAALIVSSARRADGPAVREAYAAHIALLGQLADDSLRASLDTENYVRVLQAALAFEGVEVWDERLDGLARGEYEVQCPRCGVDLFIVIGEEGFFSSSDEYTLRGVERSPLRPADPARLEGLAGRLHRQAVANGQPVVAARLSYLFGRASCPDCGAGFPVADRVVAQVPLTW
jgi:hypothetical protein